MSITNGAGAPTMKKVSDSLHRHSITNTRQPTFTTRNQLQPPMTTPGQSTANSLTGSKNQLPPTAPKDNQNQYPSDQRQPTS